MPAAAACSSSGACSLLSMPALRMPSGFMAIACVKAVARPGTEPWPSSCANVPAERLGGLRGAVAGALRAAVAPVGRGR